MVLLAGAIAGLLASLISGGSMSRLATIRFRWPAVPIVALLIRVAGVLTPWGASSAAAYVYLAALLVLLGWVAWHAQLLRGLWVVALGLAFNIAVVAANGAHMPVERSLAVSGPSELARNGVLGQYVLAGAGTRLAWLDDRIAVYGALSVGDLVMTAGLALTTFLATRRNESGPAS